MSLTRRLFLRRAGAAVLTVATAPLFIPSDRLDFGVPRLITSATDADVTSTLSWANTTGRAFLNGVEVTDCTIPMTLVYDEFNKRFGGKIKAGSTVLATQAEAERWIAHGVAVPGPGAPAALQAMVAQREAQRPKPTIVDDWHADEAYDEAAGLSAWSGLDTPLIRDGADRLEAALRKSIERHRRAMQPVTIAYDEDPA